MVFTNLRIYYSLILFNNFWFITSNWLNFWLKYMTLKEVGIIDAIAFLVGILFEFPSGIISDKLGRKQTLLLSQSLQILGSLLVTLSSSLVEIGVGFVIFQIGTAFYSGTIESFGYESGVLANKNYEKVLINSGFLSNFGYLSSLIIGGFLYTTDNNLPNILFTANFLVGLLLSILIKDTLIKEDELTKTLVNSKFNLPILALFIILMTLSFSFDYGFLKLIILENFADLNTNYWYIFIATLLSLFFSSLLIPRIINIKKSLLLCLVCLMGSVILGIFTYIPLFFVLSFLAIFIYQLSLKYINERVSDSKRASFISLFNLVYKLPYVLIALLLGYNL